MEYFECPVLTDLKRKKEPLVTKVPTDNFTDMVQANFDYDFTGESKFYPYEIPDCFKELNFQILVITGASGKGKSTFLKEFSGYKANTKTYDNSKAIVSNFDSPPSLQINSLPLVLIQCLFGADQGMFYLSEKDLEQISL